MSPSTDPAMLERQRQAELDAILSKPLPFYLSPLQTEIEAMDERDAKLPIAQRIQHLDAEIKLLKQQIKNATFPKAVGSPLNNQHLDMRMLIVEM